MHTGTSESGPTPSNAEGNLLQKENKLTRLKVELDFQRELRNNEPNKQGQLENELAVVYEALHDTRNKSANSLAVLEHDKLQALKETQIVLPEDILKLTRRSCHQSLLELKLSHSALLQERCSCI